MLLELLHKELSKRGRILSAAVPANLYTINKAYELEEMCRLVNCSPIHKWHWSMQGSMKVSRMNVFKICKLVRWNFRSICMAWKNQVAMPLKIADLGDSMIRYKKSIEPIHSERKHRIQILNIEWKN